MPKSISLTTPPDVSIMLPGLMSRCTTPRPCAYSRPLRDGAAGRWPDHRTGCGAHLASRAGGRSRSQRPRSGGSGVVAGGGLASGTPHSVLRQQDGRLRLAASRYSRTDYQEVTYGTHQQTASHHRGLSHPACEVCFNQVLALYMSFIHEDFLLNTKTARRLYHQFAEDQPILDYHCHLPPQDVAENRRFQNLFEIWLEGDHYKWRAMRANGVPESHCTDRKSTRLHSSHL